MKANPSSPLCGLVLAGGRSQRMGTDKAALRHPDGRTLARRSYDLLAEAGCDTVVLSLRHEQELPPGFDDLAAIRIARDPKGPSQGPLGGMIAAMRLHPEAAWLVLACDLPRLDSASLRNLISSIRGDEVFLPTAASSMVCPNPCARYTPPVASPCCNRRKPTASGAREKS